MFDIVLKLVGFLFVSIDVLDFRFLAICIVWEKFFLLCEIIGLLETF